MSDHDHAGPDEHSCADRVPDAGTGPSVAVVQLSSREYAAHDIGANWPHHTFVEQEFTVAGAEQAGRPAAG